MIAAVLYSSLHPLPYTTLRSRRSAASSHSYSPRPTRHDVQRDVATYCRPGTVFGLCSYGNPIQWTSRETYEKRWETLEYHSVTPSKKQIQLSMVSVLEA